jgi:hypothetical protein
MRIEDHLQSLEEQLLDPAVRRNSELVATMLADNFIEFGSSGRIFTKASILEDLRNEPPRPASTLTDFATREISPSAILATYKATRRNLAGEITGQSLRSSLWIHLDGRWQITFHQGTPIAQSPINSDSVHPKK